MKLDNRKLKKTRVALDKFFHSNLYLYIITILGGIGFAFDIEIYIIHIISYLTFLGLIFSKRVMHIILSMLIIGMLPLARYGEVDYFSSLYYLSIPLITSFVLHLLIHKIEVKKGYMFWPIILVGIAVSSGGLFYLDFSQYFSMPSYYYTFTLGIGMILFYLFFNSKIIGKEDIVFFIKIMISVGFMGIFMFASHHIPLYLEQFPNTNFFSVRVQWKNNLSNNLLLSLPFFFYVSYKSKNLIKKQLFYILGLFIYFMILVLFARGAIIAASSIILFITLAPFLLKPKENLTLLIPFFIFFVSILIFGFEHFERYVNIMTVSSDEARANLYYLAFQNFIENPFFGVGLAYDGGVYYNPQPMAMYWYHSTFFQIIGSLGLVGILAYSSQLFYRIRLFISNKNYFNLTCFFSYLGFGIYSLVNVGYFVFFPFVATLVIMFIIIDKNNHISTN